MLAPAPVSTVPTRGPAVSNAAAAPVRRTREKLVVGIMAREVPEYVVLNTHR
jgi:hypothetical protein